MQPFRHHISWISALGLIALSGCSTVMEGRSQQVTVRSTPQGAQCILKQADTVVARLTTPGTAEVKKTKNDLVVSCSKPGYETVSFDNRSDYSLISLGNMAFGQYSFVGNAVDSLSGASNKYDSEVSLVLARAETPMAFPAPLGAPPVVKLSQQQATALSMQVPLPMGAADKTISPVSTVSAEKTTPKAESKTAASSSPAITASLKLADAGLKAADENRVMPVTYAQAMNESPRRPPFEVTQ